MSALIAIACATTDEDCGGDGGEIVRAIAYVTVAGAAAGGAAFHEERWELVPLDRLRAASKRRGLHASFRIRF